MSFGFVRTRWWINVCLHFVPSASCNFKDKYYLQKMYTKHFIRHFLFVKICKRKKREKRRKSFHYAFQYTHVDRTLRHRLCVKDLNQNLIGNFVNWTNSIQNQPIGSCCLEFGNLCRGIDLTIHCQCSNIFACSFCFCFFFFILCWTFFIEWNWHFFFVPSNWNFPIEWLFSSKQKKNIDIY